MPETKYIYMILDETDAWGLWTNPQDAVKWYFEDDTDKDGLIKFRNKKCTVASITEQMLDQGSDYPVLEKIELDPTKNPWTLDR